MKLYSNQQNAEQMKVIHLGMKTTQTFSSARIRRKSLLELIAPGKNSRFLDKNSFLETLGQELNAVSPITNAYMWKKQVNSLILNPLYKKL